MNLPSKLKITISAVFVPISDVEETPLWTHQSVQQTLLRAAGNHRSVYVWSDTLKAHVRIGERA